MREITPSNKERTTNTTDLHYLTSLFTDSQALSAIRALTSSAYIYYTYIIHGVQHYRMVMFKAAKIKDQNSGSQFRLGGPLLD